MQLDIAASEPSADGHRYCPVVFLSFTEPRKHQGFLSLTLRNFKTLHNKQKPFKNTKDVHSTKNTKETETPRKKGQGMAVSNTSEKWQKGDGNSREGKTQ